MLKSKYQSAIVELQKELNLSSVAAVPKITKVVVNVGVGSKTTKDSKFLDMVVSEITKITGQKPIVTKARKSIAGFKLREGMPVGVTVTLRGNRMYDFLDRLILVALARVRDFQGLNPNSFDGQGNYTFGIKEHTIFPEILFENVDQVFSMEVTVATTAEDDNAARLMLTKLGFPFVKANK